MKKTGLCVTCGNNLHCSLTRESGVLECEEFLNSIVLTNKPALRKKQTALEVDNTQEE